MIKQNVIRIFLVGILLSFNFSNLVYAQNNIKAIRFEAPPKLDGFINDKCWEATEPARSFQQREPIPGNEATVATAVYFGYDSKNLYIGIRCFIDPEKITAKELSRDVDLSDDDRVQIILDTYNDKRNAFWFQIGPRGSIGDAIVSENGAAFNKAWDGLWSGKAHIHDKGWDAEMVIPFKTLSFEKENDQWGLKLIRYQKSREEVVYWPEANINSHKFQVSDGGTLSGLHGISQGIGLDFIPYALGGIDFEKSKTGASYMADAGFEAYYNITSSLRAALTINTDFAQTEVDRQQINLTRFNLFYPEKRDIFLDGANYFNFGINGDGDNQWKNKMIPFFSRRIGLDSGGNPIPVQYGGKITGQSGSWNIGAMYMKDEREGWENGNFAVSRISKNIGEQSHVGLISTYGNSIFDASNLLLGFDVKLATSRFRGDKNMSLVMYGLKSSTKSGNTATISNGRDLSFGAEFVYPNDNLSLRLGHMQIQENFVAGLGFVPRPGVRQSYGELTLAKRPEKWGIMQVLGGLTFDHVSNFDGKLLTRKWEFMPLKIRFLKGEEIDYNISSTYDFLDKPFYLYTDYIIPASDYLYLMQTFSFTSAKRKKLWGSLDYSFGTFYNGNRNELKLQAGYKVAVPLFIGGELSRNNIELESGSFVANVYRLNLNILFSPDISLYNFLQYDSQSNKMGWQSRFQWILKPGREIFLVWNSIVSDPYEKYQIQEGNLRLKLKFTVRI